MTYEAKYALALAGAAVLMLGAAAPASATDIADDSEAVCIEEALDRSLEVWTCLGGTLTYFGEDENGEEVTVSEEVAPTVVTDMPAEQGAAARAAFDGDDSWCEQGTVCRTITNDFAGKAKGNVAWGNTNGVNGSFDLVIRSNLNGRQSQSQVKIFRDSGANLSFSNLSVECKHKGNAFGCGSKYADNEDGKVSVSSQWIGPTVYGAKLNQQGTYNDLVTGRVTPTGAPVLPLPSLAGPQFDCTSGTAACRFP